MEVKALYKKFLKYKGVSAPKNKVQSKKPITVSNVGLWDKSKKKVIVPSNRITMKGPKGEQDFFKRPVLATGLQSGKQVLMQPGREYYFPEDNEVFEKRMQGGGELVLDAASMIPGPVGMTASGLGLAYDVAEGDWVGAGLNTANILTGGSAKGLMAAARVANNAGTRNLARGLASGSHSLNRASKVANNYSKPVDTTRNINNLLQDNYQTQRGGYQDNTRVVPTVRPVKPKMQSGGLYAVGPYDKMMAPKQGNYLLPDINRPSYKDEFGGRRSEYKMGFNDNGKEVLIPTVVQGKQLSEDEAVDNYYRTGLHMGKYDTVQDAENASALRTAKYNMLQDPIRFKMSDYVPNMQDGGTVQTNMLQPIKEDEESLPVILDSLFSQFQKTKQEFGVEPEEPEELKKPETPSLQTGGHVIQPGETFFGIANKYNLTKEDLIDANPNVDINSIQAGQSLKIPIIESVGQVEVNAAAAKTPTKWFDYINPMNWGAPNYDDAGNFRQAFRKARIEGENDFMWYGDRYSSDLANLENKRQALVKDIAEETETLKPVKTNKRSVAASLPSGIDNDILLRQAYKESTFDPKAQSPAGYMGLAQIGDEVIKDYKRATGVRSVDAYNPEQNAAVQRWAMNQIYNSDFVNKKNQSDEVRLAKTLASYNWGKGNVRNYLKRQKAKGVDIYNSLDWLEELPQETRDYVHKIQLRDVPEFDEEFNQAINNKKYSPYVQLYQKKKYGGLITKYQNGGDIETEDDDDDDREMVEGIADILKQVNDKNNRKQIAKKMVEDFEEEEVEYDLDNFLKASRLMQMGGMSIPRVNGTVVASTPSLYKKYKSGGQHGGLDRWFAEKWVDVKTGEACGRSGTDKDGRPYPACRPSKRISSKTPKTSSEMSSQEKARFKATKTSSQRIPYNHKRK